MTDHCIIRSQLVYYSWPTTALSMADHDTCLAAEDSAMLWMVLRSVMNNAAAGNRIVLRSVMDSAAVDRQ